MHNTNPLIHCMIVDDELSSQKVLQHFISKTEVLHLKHTSNHPKDAFKYLQLHTDIDVLFLDINMPQQTGLDFYKSLKNPPEVIFTTAYPQYAVDGFEVNAVDYLLKPFAYERFITAVGKVLTKKSGAPKTDFIILKENKSLHRVLINSILYVEAYGDYVKVYTKNTTIITHSTFKKLIERLPKTFLRVHKSFSINMDKLQQLSGNTILLDHYKIPIGQTYKTNILKALKVNL